MTPSLVKWASVQPDSLDAFFERWWTQAEHFRWLRIKGGINVINAGKIG